jgi:hypothetical protein
LGIEKRPEPFLKRFGPLLLDPTKDHGCRERQSPDWRNKKIISEMLGRIAKPSPSATREEARLLPTSIVVAKRNPRTILFGTYPAYRAEDSVPHAILTQI